jgi:hypothetical protein
MGLVLLNLWRLAHLERRREVAEAISLLCDMPHARPWEVVGDEWNAVGRQHVQNSTRVFADCLESVS